MQFSDAIVSWLKNIGYTHCFFVAGGNIMHILNSVRNEMVCVPFVNEIGAAIAAESFNELRNEGEGKSFVLVTAGPGLTNIVTGIAGAWLESRELLVIGGQVKSSDLSNNEVRQRGIQEINGVEIVKSISKKSLRITKPINSEQFYEIVSYGTKARKGPVFIEICLDVQAMELKSNNLKLQKHKNLLSDYKESDLLDTIKELTKSKRPIILLGGGLKFEVAKKLSKKLENIKVPMMTTWNGADRISSDLKNYFGRPNTWGQRYSNVLIQQADLVLAIGTRLGMQQTGFAWENFAPLARIIQVEIDKNELAKGHPKIHLGINGDANTFLEQLVNFPGIEKLDISEWITFCNHVKSLLPLAESENQTRENYVDPYRFGIEINQYMAKNDVLVPCSSGNTYTVLMQTAQLVDNQRMISSKGLASMGYGLSTAIGAAILNTENRIFLVEGDGGFAQNLQELGTVAANNLAIKIFIWANNGYASIRTTQRNYFDGAWIGCDSETGLGLPNWRLIAASYEIDYHKMTNKVFDDPCLINKLHSNDPLIVEVPIDPEQTFFPKITSSVQPDGSMKSNPLHLMTPPLPNKIENRVLKYLTNWNSDE